MKATKATRRLLAFLAVHVTASLAVSGMGAAHPTESVVGALETKFDGAFSPKALPERKPAPIAASFSWKVRNREGLRPSPLTLFRLRGDDHVEFDAGGVPECRLPKRSARLDTAAVRKKCGRAVIGGGKITVGVELAGEFVIDADSELLAVKGGPTDLYLYAFLPAPATGAVAVPVAVRKIRKGNFGTELIVPIPKFAGGAGSVTDFRLGFDRGILRATCPGKQHLNAEVTAMFVDGTDVSGEIMEPCSRKAESGDGPKRAAN